MMGMSKGVFLFRLALGGLAVGFVAGSMLGGLVGLIVGCGLADATVGLDGALLGGIALGVLGCGYGLLLGCSNLTSRRVSDHAPSPERAEDRHDFEDLLNRKMHERTR